MSDQEKTASDQCHPNPLLPRASSAEELEEFLCFAVYETNLAFNQVYRSLLNDIGLTYPQYLVMTLLWHRDGRPVKEIGEALNLEYNTLTPLIKRLEAMSFIDRVRDAEDQRIVRVFLRPEGKALSANAKEIPECIAEASGLSAKAFAQLKTSLEELRANLKAAAGK